MGLTDDNLLYLGTMRAISVWSLNRFTTFWAATRSHLSEMKLVSGEAKSTRVLAVCLDNRSAKSYTNQLLIVMY
ncbi:hypothetical protein LSH36_497g00002 [Paralvinella palmiformis]|uniref:Uncharacterized protein n=1 Tax=Paralvinella palmiformis TaxID=53620 RepID=A0AAD9MWW6_9ANNE|nr:hypothetical protein LSH36_497g00002 [Paralvinella palmiformis]